MRNFKNDPTNQLIIAFLILLGVLLLFSCNSVKMVLKDESKSRKVWDEGIRIGICSNDTVIVFTTDTLISYDTITRVKLDSMLVHDTLVFWENKFYEIIKTKQVIKEVTNTIVDSSQVKLLKLELSDTKKKLLDTQEKRKMWMHNFFASAVCLLFATIGLILAIKYKK